jgi:uncharacterized membrane protein
MPHAPQKNSEKPRSEDLPKPQDIRRELERTRSDGKHQSSRRPKYYPALTFPLVVLVLLGCLQGLLAAKYFSQLEESWPFLITLVTVAILCTAVIFIALVIQFYAISRIDDTASRYNSKRVLWLAAVMALAFIILSLVFVH